MNLQLILSHDSESVFPWRVTCGQIFQHMAWYSIIETWIAHTMCDHTWRSHSMGWEFIQESDAVLLMLQWQHDPK